jgi:hypothetical protein
MPNDPNGDIQLKPASSDNSGTPVSTGANTSGTSGSTGQSGSQQKPVTPADDASAPVAGTPAPTAAKDTPKNKRAFDLAADVENSATGMAKPEKFAIPKKVTEKYPDLVALIKETESMDDEERQYWFQILPVMTDEQIKKFKNILITEKDQLAELDKEYEDELNRLNEKHLLEWKEFETKEKSKALQEAETKSNVAEEEMEEDLLAQLGDV